MWTPVPSDTSRMPAGLRPRSIGVTSTIVSRSEPATSSIAPSTSSKSWPGRAGLRRKRWSCASVTPRSAAETGPSTVITSGIGGTIGGMSLHLGLDLGGTNLKWAVVERGAAARVVKTGRVPTDTREGEKSVLRQMIGVATGVAGELKGITSIGVGMPGVLDPEAGITRFLPNVPGSWAGVPVTAEVARAARLPTRLINDARAFALAEHDLGAGRGATSMLGVTLGTGVGGGLVLDGRLYLGYEGTAGEFGHQTILPDGPL